MSDQLQTPIALFVFNRPHLTDLSFARIKDQRPARLFLIADGPRETIPIDVALTKDVRKIVSQVNWPCEVETLYAARNLGVQQRITSGLDWVFSHVDRAIILEDDCLAGDSFFNLCETLLSYYEDDKRVGAVTGNNFQDGLRRGQGSYYFSKYPHCWGWATWARAWALNDPLMRHWPDLKRSARWESLVSDPFERRYWEKIFDQTFAGKIDSWAYRWAASCFHNELLTATPNVNLVRNIGFGSDATHTKTGESPATAIGQLSSIDHPSTVTRDLEAERYDFENVYGGRELRDRGTLRGWSAWFLRGVWKRLVHWTSD